MSAADAPPSPGLSERLVSWMAAHRGGLDVLMEQEGSRAIHEEFLMAEGGVLPDRRDRLDRARSASARAWLRHLGTALAEEWPGAPAGMPAALEQTILRGGERLEALILEEGAVLERHGLSGDPVADRRDADLTAYCRLFAEGVGGVLEEDGGPEFGRRVADAARRRAGRLRQIEAEAREAWSAAPAAGRTSAASTPEPDALRVAEAAAVWAHVRVLTEALEETLVEDAPAG